MHAPSRIVRVLFAWIGYSSVHWASGRWRRALVWDALFVAIVVAARTWPVVLLLLPLLVAQIVDAARIVPARERSTGGYALVALVVMCVTVVVQTTVRGVWSEAFKIPSGAMIPTLQVGDRIMVDKTVRHPQRGDVDVFIYPREPDKDYVKRVIAVGGDTIEIRDNVIILNGQAIPRRHVDGDCSYDDYNEELGHWEKRDCDAWDETLDGHTYRVIFERDGMKHSMAPKTIPAGEFFVMGDNRDNSFDSRFWGGVPERNLKGRATYVWWSMGRNGVRWDRIDRRVP